MPDSSHTSEDVEEMFSGHPTIQLNPEILEEIVQAHQQQTSCPVAGEPCRTINSFIGCTMNQKIISKNLLGDLFEFDPKSYKHKPNRAAISLFLHEHFQTVAFNKTVYIYNTEQGIYVPGEATIDAAIYELCRIGEHEELVASVQDFAIPHLRGRNVYSKYPFDQKPHNVPFMNGTVRLSGKTWVREEMRASDLITWRLGFPYDPLAPTLPVEKVFAEWVDEENAHLLVQIPAHALLHLSVSSPYKMNYLLIGEHDAGKSSYIDLLQLFFGMDRCSEVPLQLIGGKFKNAEMEGKLINLYDDLQDNEFTNLGAFKKLTGRFQHSIERKGRDGYEGLIRCVHVFSANKPPTINITDDDAFFSRWQPVIFPHEFERVVGWQEKTYTPQFLSGLANLVLNKYVNVLENDLTSDYSIEEVKDFWMRQSMPEYSFMMDCLETGVGYTIPIEECYDLYKVWMVAKGYPASKIKNNVHFGRAMNKQQMIKSGQETISKGYRVDVYKGVRKKVMVSKP